MTVQNYPYPDDNDHTMHVWSTDTLRFKLFTAYGTVIYLGLWFCLGSIHTLISSISQHSAPSTMGQAWGLPTEYKLLFEIVNG